MISGTNWLVTGRRGFIGSTPVRLIPAARRASGIINLNALTQQGALPTLVGSMLIRATPLYSQNP